MIFTKRLMKKERRRKQSLDSPQTIEANKKISVKTTVAEIFHKIFDIRHENSTKCRTALEKTLLINMNYSQYNYQKSNDFFTNQGI